MSRFQPSRSHLAIPSEGILPGHHRRNEAAPRGPGEKDADPDCIQRRKEDAGNWAKIKAEGKAISSLPRLESGEFLPPSKAYKPATSGLVRTYSP